MGGSTPGLPFKLFDNPVSVDQESSCLEVVMVIQQIDETLELVGKQERTELLAIGLLNINQRMLAVEMRDNEVSSRRDA
jgi:hypothetical protein